MKRIAINTNTINRILDTPNALDEIKNAWEHSVLILRSNHLLRDELGNTQDPSRRASLLAIYDSLPMKEVPTRGAIFGMSRFDEARFGDGQETGISIAEAKTKRKKMGSDSINPVRSVS